MNQETMQIARREIKSILGKKGLTKKELEEKIFDTVWYVAMNVHGDGVREGKAQAAANLTSALIDLAQRAAEEGQE
jgi:polyribonucleotide nucleotidyltransferase